jgi:LL-diaminopimelate aminotransferase
MAFEVEFSKRLDLFGAEIFAALNDKKVALEAQGKKLYNLSVGTPDFEPMPHIKQALCDAAMVSENWKYSLRDLPELLDTVCAYYKRRRDALCGGFRSIGWDVPDSHGSMFVWAPVPQGHGTSMEFCMEMIEKAGVICTPGSSFGPSGEGYVRFALTLPVEKITEAVQAVKNSGLVG